MLDYIYIYIHVCRSSVLDLLYTALCDISMKLVEENTIGNCALANRLSGAIHSNSIHGFTAVETQGIQFGELLHTYEHRHSLSRDLGYWTASL